MRKYKGKILDVYQQKIRLPNDNQMLMEYICHKGAVCVVPVLKQDMFVFIKQYRPVLGRYIYEFPAGIREKNESPILCARRELTEETGYKARLVKKVGYIYPTPGYSNEKIYIYLATYLKKYETCHDLCEVIDVAVLTKREIKKLLYGGKIVDAKTICALAMAKII